MSNKRAIESVKSNLRYMEEDMSSAISAAKDIKDPELTKKLDNIKGEVKGVKDYLASRLDPKQG